MQLPAVGVLLFARSLGDLVDLFLTDGQSIAISEQHPLSDLSASLQTSALWHALFDVAAHDLRLQVDGAINSIGFEALTSSTNPSLALGRRFRVSRSVVGEATLSEPPKNMRVASAVKAIRFVSDDSSESPSIAKTMPGLNLTTQRFSSLVDTTEPLTIDVLDFSSTALDPSCYEPIFKNLTGQPKLICIQTDSFNSGINELRKRASQIAPAVLLYPSLEASELEQANSQLNLIQRILQSGLTLGQCSSAIREHYLAGMVLYGDCQFELRAKEVQRLDSGFRQVTSMSFDLVGSTELIRQMGSERYSVLLNEFHQICSSVIVAHGGRPDQPQGDDGIMAYFGFPTASEGATRKAVLAGLEMCTSVALMGLQMRIGIAVGQVAVRNNQPVGLSVHLAARLQTFAKPNQVLISQDAKALIDRFFNTQVDAENINFKGVNTAQTLHQVVSLKNMTETGAHNASRHQTPFVGRSNVFEQLTTVFNEGQNSIGACIVITGEPGIGKSRLLHEWRQKLLGEKHRFFSIRGEPDNRSSPFRALINSIQNFLELNDKATRQEVIDRFRFKLPEVADQLDAASTRLLLDVISPTDASTSQDGSKHEPAEKIREKTLRLLSQLVGQVAGELQLSILVDDAHWVDPSTLELIDRLAAPDIFPKLFVLIAIRRATRSDSPSNWRPQLPYQVIELERLSHQDSMAILAIDPSLNEAPTQFLSAAIERSEGIPLFLEETVRMMGVKEPSSVYSLNDVAHLGVPSSIQELLLARLDQCGAAKQLVLTASVFGREFSMELVEAVFEELNDLAGIQELSSHLEILIALDLVYAVEKNDRSHTYRFKHILLRDTAYNSLWQQDRQNLHRVIANVLHKAAPEVERLQPESLALHLTEAGDFQAAVETWESASKLASTRSANTEAIRFLEAALSALSHCPPAKQRDARELKLRLSLAAKQIATLGYGASAVQDTYQAAAKLAHLIHDEKAQRRITLGLEAFHFMRAEFDQALELARSAHQGPMLDESSWEMIQPIWAEANVEWHKGHLSRAVQLMDDCLARYRPELHRPNSVQDPGVMCLCYSAWSFWEMGDLHEALQRVRRAVSLAQQLGHTFSQGVAHGFLATLQLFIGDYASALREANVSYALCDDSGFQVWLAHARVIRGRAMVGMGQTEQGIAEIQAAYALWTNTGAIVTRPLYLSLHAEVFLIDTQPEMALEFIDQGLTIAKMTGEHYHKAELLRLKAIAIIVSSPSMAHQQGLQLLQQAANLAMEQGKYLFALRCVIYLHQLLAPDEVPEWAKTLLFEITSRLENNHNARKHGSIGLPELVLAKSLLSDRSESVH